MPTSLPRENKPRNRRFAAFWSQDDVRLLAVTALPATIIVFALLLPPVLILPAVAVTAICAGFALEGMRLFRWGWAGPAHGREYAAGLVFAGLAASILADAEGAMLALSELAADGAAKSTDDR